MKYFRKFFQRLERINQLFFSQVYPLSDVSKPKPSLENNPDLTCPEKYRKGSINPKEFFVFHNGMVWCNVFKSASTR